MTWRDDLRPMIRTVVSQVRASGITEPKQVWKECNKQMPSWVKDTSWLSRKWRHEAKLQLGLMPEKVKRISPTGGLVEPIVDLPGQLRMFD